MVNKIITGMTKTHGRCLACICGENAEKELERMINSPTENDKRIIGTMTDLRIDEVEEKDCWWKQGLD